MRIKIEIFMGIALFFCFVITGLFGNAMALSSDDLIDPQGNEIGSNTWYGEGAGSTSTHTGINNSFFGFYAGHANTTGHDNSFFGLLAGYNNTTGYGNSFFGQSAGNKNIAGTSNSFFGQYAGLKNTTGGANSFFGASAGYNNTGYNNSFFGWSAGHSNTTGGANSFFGASAGNKNTIGAANSFFGRGAGYNNTTGTSNSFFGRYAGYTNETGIGNVFLGYKAGYKETGSNKLYIDNSDTEHPLISGDFATNNVIIYGGFRSIASYSSSDGRWKKNIEPLESSLDKVSNLQGVSYEWKIDEYPDLGLTKGKQIGLVAQNVEKELPELVSEDKDGYKAVSYTKLTAVLVEAVKELKAENDALRADNSALREAQRMRFQKQQTEIEELRSMICELKS